MSKKELKARIEALEARVAMLEAQNAPPTAPMPYVPSWTIRNAALPGIPHAYRNEAGELVIQPITTFS